MSARRNERGRRGLAAVALLLILAALAAPGRAGTAAPAAPPPDLVVCPTCDLASISDAVARAAAGNRIEVRGGVYPGGLVIDKPVVLVGVGQPVIDGGGKGSLVHVTATDVTIEGFVLRRTGTSHDKEDSAIVVDAERATIVDNRIEDALFGLYLRKAHGSVLRGNVVQGKAAEQALRGDGIRIWYSNDVLVERNVATDGRDIILWYSNNGVVRDNDFDRNRYGLHLMYSDNALIERNALDANTIGLYIMYSRNPVVRGNSLSDNFGASGGGLGLKDVDGARVEGNRFVNNQIGAQVDTSPREPNIENYFIGNVFAYNQIGIGFQPAVRHNTLVENAFIDNGEHVAILGRGQLRDITWARDGRGNFWSDYAGYDATGDGVGDLPYTSQHLFEALVAEHPALRLFMYSPAATAIDFAAKAFPAVRPEVKFTDPSPLMAPSASPLLPPLPAVDQPKRAALGLAAATGGGLAVALAVALRRRRDWSLERFAGPAPVGQGVGGND